MAQHQGRGFARIKVTADQTPPDKRREYRDQRDQPGGDQRGKFRSNKVDQT
jgi:hypothetical protein